MIPNHEWRLVGPWYYWQRQLDAEQRKPWQTKPVFQKFDATEFVKTFTQDPQLSLKFLDSEDTVFETSLKDVPKVGSGPMAGRFTQLYAPKKPGGAKADSAQEATLVPTGTRKLYLATHKRNYLVVSELHCYAPGFPKVTPAQVCQAGFVVRRRALSIPAAQQAAAHKAVAQILKEINSVKSDLAFWQQTTPAIGLRSKRRSQAVQKAIANGTYQATVKDLQTKLSAAQQKLTDWRATYSVSATLEGWIPGFNRQSSILQSVNPFSARSGRGSPRGNRGAAFRSGRRIPSGGRGGECGRRSLARERSAHPAAGRKRDPRNRRARERGAS